MFGHPARPTRTRTVAAAEFLVVGMSVGGHGKKPPVRMHQGRSRHEPSGYQTAGTSASRAGDGRPRAHCRLDSPKGPGSPSPGQRPGARGIHPVVRPAQRANRSIEERKGGNERGTKGLRTSFREDISAPFSSPDPFSSPEVQVPFVPDTFCPPFIPRSDSKCLRSVSATSFHAESRSGHSLMGLASFGSA